ncbi:MAG TPA: cytochrome c biogenesis protein CcdA [Propionibacteriaceae bacterium]|nr:cytochrome c biogenesis protein CcdA [Propionibacteriaceae bacterium]
MVLALPVALLAGLVSFFSPCVVPLLPGYLSYATGLGAAEVIEGPKRKSRMLLGTTGFVLGFAVIFVITGVVAGSLGQALYEYRTVINRVLGVVVIALGLIFAGLLPIGQRDLRPHRVPAVGVAAAPLLGMVFALGWTPCISPTLGVVVNLGFNEGTALRGGLLGFVYALGLGIPFVLAGLAFSRMSRAMAFFREHQQMIMRIGGVLLVVVGLMLLTGAWDWLTSMLRQWAASFETAI